MPTTSRDAAVMSRVAPLARDLTEQLLQGRRIWLKHRAPKSAYVHQLRRDLSAERKKSVEFLLAISFADIDDGLSPTVATQMYRSIIALIEERAQQRARLRGEAAISPEPLTLVQRESAAQAAKDDAERAYIADPASPETMQRLIEADAAYEIANDRLVNTVRSRLARTQLAAV